MSDNLVNGNGNGNGTRALPVKERYVPILLRWSAVLEVCRKRGLSQYAVRQAVASKRIRKRLPKKPFKGTQFSRAYYLRDEVLEFCESFLGSKK
jgi:hypothetical protein